MINRLDSLIFQKEHQKKKDGKEMRERYLSWKG